MRAALFVVLALPLIACDNTGPAASIGRPPDGLNADSTVPPPDSAVGPGVDSVAPPGTDSVAPPDSTGPVEPPVIPVHVGIPFGPTQQTAANFGSEFTGTLIPGTPPDLLATLEAARRANVRVFIQFSGNEAYNRDENGFSLTKWKQRVDRFRGMDLTSYIADGTILGHRIMDEPSDPSNWNGHLVSLPDIEEMARYSKEIWPNMPAVIRAFPAYLQGYQFQHLDAAWAQYIARFGDIDSFIATNVRDAKAAGLALVGGLNLLNGGSGESRIPGTRHGNRPLWGMSADEIRTWGGAFLSEPYICAFLMFEYHSEYLSRPDIKAALSELKQKAEKYPKKDCRP